MTGMRSDLPRPPGQADQPPPARSRERLAELRGRLERLPPGHPSSPGYPLPPGAPWDDQEASEPAESSPDLTSPEHSSGGPGGELAGPGGGKLAGPGGGGLTGSAGGELAGPDGAELVGPAGGDDGTGQDAGREPGGAGGRPGDDAQPEPGRAPGPGRTAAPAPGAYAGPWGAPEPHRPWFSEADWAAPWFTAVF